MEEDEFKDTEIGRIPKDWEVLELEEIFSPVNLNDRKVVIDPKEEYKLIKTMLYSKGVVLKDVVEGKKIKAKFMYELKDNDFIFSKINLKKGALGFVGSELEGSVVSSEHPILKLNTEKAYKDYIKYYFYQTNVWSLLKVEAKGFSGKERIKIREFLLFKIVLPSLEEQKRIAHILFKIENAIKIQDRIINSLQELKKSMMHKLFTEGIGHTEFRDTEIGRIPKEWNVLELGKISNILMGQSPPGKTYNNDGKGFPFLQGKAEFGPFYPRPIKFTTSPLKIAKSGSILISVRAPVGDVNIANNNYCIGRGLASISVIKGSNIFLFYLLKYFKQNIEKEGTGSTFKAINKNKLKNFKIPFPQLEEQKRIADILSTMDNKISIEEDRKKYFEALFKTMLNKLMTGQIRVKNLEMRE